LTRRPRAEAALSGRATRRGTVALLATLAVPARLARAAAGWTGRQFHNQPEDSHLHRFLVDLWASVGRETHGRLRVTVTPQDGGLPGSDPAMLDRLVDGEVEFFCLMGGILGRIVPTAEIQGLPFAFADRAAVYRTLDGPLGDLLAGECAARGIHYFRKGILENGFRHLGLVERPVRTVGDLQGLRIRVPQGEMFSSLFAALGAEPVAINIDGLYAALKDHAVDGHENPLVITEFNRLYEVTRRISLTGHTWSGFNMLANGRFWARLPEDVRQVVERNVMRAATRQRAFTAEANSTLATTLAARGMIFDVADTAGFRARLGSSFYRDWKERLGRAAWSLLEDQVGPLPSSST
jgi:tripartite ATP-independent transporter DctP family solute receptor